MYLSLDCIDPTLLNIQALEVIEGHRGRKVKLIDSIGDQWEEVAKALDMNQENIDNIKTIHSDKDIVACHAMLTTWLEGSSDEVSWTALIQALNDAGLLELADSLRDMVFLQ